MRLTNLTPPLHFITFLVIGCFILLAACSEQEKQVDPGNNQEKADQSTPPLSHTGDNDLCPPSPSQNDCKEHCGDYKIALDNSVPCNELQILMHYEDCVEGSGFDSLWCYKAKKDPKESSDLKHLCRCCDANDDSEQTIQCAKHGFADEGFMKEVRQNNNVYEEYSGELAYYQPEPDDECRHTKVDSSDKVTCCNNGYWAEYDPSTEVITIGCL